MIENNYNEKIKEEKYYLDQLGYYFIFGDQTCTSMHYLSMYDKSINKTIKVKAKEITNLLETYIKNKETLDSIIKTLNE